MHHATDLRQPARPGADRGAGPGLGCTWRLALCVGADLAAPRVRPELAHHGWRCHHVAAVGHALQAVAAIGFDALLVSDTALVGEFVPRLSALRRAFAGPLLVLAPRGDEIDEILALELGADDYLGPPFNAHRLRARLVAAMRVPAAPGASAAGAEPARAAGTEGWAVDLPQALLRGPGHSVRLSSTQAAVMALLLDRAGAVVSRDEVARHLGMPFEATRGRAVDMCLHHLRRRLAEAGVTQLTIETVRGIGYALHAGDAEAALPGWGRTAPGAARLVAVA